MKFIMVFHANLHYSGLRPEIFEFVIRKSYGRILDLFEQRFRGRKFCFEASGFTLDMIAKVTPDILKRLRQAVESGQCEFIGSPYAHSIVSNFNYADGVKACEFAMQTYQRHLGMTPKTAWNPECCWNDDVPRIYRDSGFEIMNLDWDSYLISTRKEIATVERSQDPTLKDGSHMPWFDVDPDTPTLHFPIKIMDGLTGIFRSDRVSAQTLYYLMSTSPAPVDESAKINVSLESLLKTVDHWSGKKRQGSLICYAEDAEYVGTTGYFFLKRYGSNRVFDDNPDAARLLSSYIDALLERGDLGHVVEAVDEGPVLQDQNFRIEDGMAWHRAYAVAWAKTPSAIACDPYCKMISDQLQKIAEHPRSQEEEVLYQKAWFHLICAENSDGRWPPYPKKPGNFNVHYIWDQLIKARQTLALIAGTDFKEIPSTEINPET